MVLTGWLATASKSTPLHSAPAFAGEPRCLGDCNGDQKVTVGELIRGVNVALMRSDLSDCPAFDDNGDQRVTVNELVRAVTNALTGCAPRDALEPGLSALSAGNLIAANGAFSAAAAANPADARAILYLALTRLPVDVLGDSRVLDLLDRGGATVSGGLEDVCGIHVTLPKAAGVPSTAPRTGEIADTARDILLPEVQQALDSLQRIPADAVILFDLGRLPHCLHLPGRSGIVQIDRGDVLALTAALYATAGAADLLTAYDVDADLHAAVNLSREAFLASAPHVLMLKSSDRLHSARSAFRSALPIAGQAIDSILGEQDDQGDDVLTIMRRDVDQAMRLEQALDLGRQSLDGVVTFPTSLGFRMAERLDLSLLFSASFQSLRNFLPRFDDSGNFDVHRFPDPTFGGTTPDLTQQDIEEIIHGGPACAPCESDGDCQSFIFLTPECSSCLFDCSGTVRRCSSTNDAVQCEDGYF